METTQLSSTETSLTPEGDGTRPAGEALPLTFSPAGRVQAYLRAIFWAIAVALYSIYCIAVIAFVVIGAGVLLGAGAAFLLGHLMVML